MPPIHIHLPAPLVERLVLVWLLVDKIEALCNLPLSL